MEHELYHLANKHGLNQEEINDMAIPSYTHKNPLVRWVFHKRLERLSNFANFEGKTILDFGCGPGMLFPKYKKAGKVYACDLRPQIAKDKAKKIGLKVNFINNIDEIPNSSLDIAIFADVLEHVTDVDALLKTLKRKMKTTGAILVSLPTESLFYKICRFIAGYGRNPDYHINNPLGIERKLDEIFKKERKIRFPSLSPLFKLYKYAV